jgi:hypothetical protein
MTKRAELFEQQLRESQDYYKRQCEQIKSELKMQYGNELSRMNTKMQDMMKSHSNAIDLLKKQHQSTNSFNSNTNSRNIPCQTDVTSKDIDLLEAFKQKYLDTLSRMKSDMMKEYDAQTLRVSEKVQRQLSEERLSLKDKVHAILMPKMIDLLRDFKINETIIRMKTKDLENDLNIIVFANDQSPSGPNSSSRPSSAFSSSNINSNQGINTKRSVSALTAAVRPVQDDLQTKNSSYNTNFQLYSKSASSMKEMTGSIKSIMIDDPKNDKFYESHFDSKNLITSKPTVNTIGPSGTASTSSGGGYKYTPLRQSWSNLTQMNNLSPYSISNSNSSNNSDNRKFQLLEETISNNLGSSQEQRLNEVTSPTMRKVTTNRPRTLLTENSKNNQPDINERDFVQFDDDDRSESELSPSRNAFYKKNRAQNVRYKKTTPKILQLPSSRPHSASILLRNHTDSPNHTDNSLYSPSVVSLTEATPTTGSKNPIETLYEMSKNYKTVETVSHKGSYLTRSHTDVSSDPYNRRYQLSHNGISTTDMDKIKPKTNLNIYKKSRSTNFISENDDETPMRLSDINDTEESARSSTNQMYQPQASDEPLSYMEPTKTNSLKSTQTSNSLKQQQQQPQQIQTNEIKRAVTIIKNPSLKSSTVTTTSSATGQATTNNALMFNSNSLPRTRTPTHTTTTAANTALSSANSTQYHPTSSASFVPNNLVKNQSNLTKKKPVFY